MKKKSGQTFSQELEKWLRSDRPKTLASLIEVFGERSFAIIVLLLMIIPALPLPTGGISHVLEIVAMLLALEMIAGLENVWLPATWQHKKLGQFMERRAIPAILNRVRWFEKRSSSRWQRVFSWPLMARLAGLLMLVFTLTAFLSPPFSGLDTLPSLGVVIICLGLVLTDAALVIFGTLVGSLGVAIVIGLSTLLVDLAHKLF